MQHSVFHHEIETLIRERHVLAVHLEKMHPRPNALLIRHLLRVRKRNSRNVYARRIGALLGEPYRKHPVAAAVIQHLPSRTPLPQPLLKKIPAPARHRIKLLVAHRRAGMVLAKFLAKLPLLLLPILHPQSLSLFFSLAAASIKHQLERQTRQPTIPPVQVSAPAASGPSKGGLFARLPNIHESTIPKVTPPDSSTVVSALEFSVLNDHTHTAYAARFAFVFGRRSK